MLFFIKKSSVNNNLLGVEGINFKKQIKKWKIKNSIYRLMSYFSISEYIAIFVLK